MNRVSDEELAKCAFEDQLLPERKAVSIANRLAMDLKDARAEIARLKAEIERLRKAGKAVVDECDYLDDAFVQVPVREINALSSEVEG